MRVVASLQVWTRTSWVHCLFEGQGKEGVALWISPRRVFFRQRTRTEISDHDRTSFEGAGGSGAFFSTCWSLGSSGSLGFDSEDFSDEA